MLNSLLTNEKSTKRIFYMAENDKSLNFMKINLDSKILSLLKSYQILHVKNLIDVLMKRRFAIDGSDTGTGKTYTTVAAIKHLNLKPVIICPITLISSWKKICSIFEIEPLLVTNYEKIKKDNYPEILSAEYEKNGEIKFYKWNINHKKYVVVFDEAHNCRNPKTMNGKLLLSTKKGFFKVMILSATLSDSPKSFSIFGYILGFYNNIKGGRKYIEYHTRENSKKIDSGPCSLNTILFPDNGSRMEMAELVGSVDFPENQISVDCYHISDEKRKKINLILEKLSTCGTDALAKITELRQELERYKLSVMYDLAKQYLDNNISVVIFLNYNESIRILAKKLETTNIIWGEQKLKEREEIISNFQENKIHIILCNIRCSDGISLHDTHGRQRVSLISPNFSSTDLIQALGRIYRSGLKTPAMQRIILCAQTYEESIYEKIKAKIEFIDKLNDSDIKMLINKK